MKRLILDFRFFLFYFSNQLTKAKATQRNMDAPAPIPHLTLITFLFLLLPTIIQSHPPTYSIISVTDFGATGGGKHYDTSAIQSAIDRRQLPHLHLQTMLRNLPTRHLPNSHHLPQNQRRFKHPNRLHHLGLNQIGRLPKRVG